MNLFDDNSPDASRAELEHAEALGETIADGIVGVWNRLKGAVAPSFNGLRGGAEKAPQPLAPTNEVLTDGGHA